MSPSPVPPAVVDSAEAPKLAPGCLNRTDDVLVHGANGVCGVPDGLARVAGRPTLPFGISAVSVVAAALAFVALRRWGRAGAGLVAGALMAASAIGYVAVLHRRADAPARMASLVAEESSEALAMQTLAAGSVGCLRVPSTCAGCEAVLHYASPTGRLCGRRLASLGAAVTATPCPPGAKCAEAHVSDAPRVH